MNFWLNRRRNRVGEFKLWIEGRNGNPLDLWEFNLSTVMWPAAITDDRLATESRDKNLYSYIDDLIKTNQYNAARPDATLEVFEDGELKESWGLCSMKFGHTHLITDETLVLFSIQSWSIPMIKSKYIKKV